MKNIFKWNKATLLLIVMGIVIISMICFKIYIRDSYYVKEVFNEEGSSSKTNIIPKPMSYQSKEGKFILTKDSVIYIKGNTDEETEQIRWIAEFIREKLNSSTGFDLQIIASDKPADGSIYLTTINSNKELGNEGYEMDTTSKGVKITAYKPEGISRGVQTLRQMLPPEIDSNTVVDNIEWTEAASVIKDKPEYSYRGLMIDVARHFFTVDEIKRQIDLAAQYKINRVHLHLSDDQGWRLEIKKYPDLTLIGGSTEVGGGPGGQIENGEDLIEGVTREVLEESGIKISVKKLAGVYSNTKSYIGWDNETFVPTKVIFDFLAVKVDGELRESEESIEVGWFSKNVVLDMIKEPWIRERANDMINFNGQVVYRVYSSRPYEVYRNEYI